MEFKNGPTDLGNLVSVKVELNNVHSEITRYIHAQYNDLEMLTKKTLIEFVEPEVWVAMIKESAREIVKQQAEQVTRHVVNDLLFCFEKEMKASVNLEAKKVLKNLSKTNKKGKNNENQNKKSKQ